MALKKLREKEEEIEKLSEDRRHLLKQTEEKEAQLQAQGRSGKMGKKDLKKYGAVVRDKIEKYKRMREELSSLRAELVTLQRTEQILKGRMQNLDAFLAELERKRGVEGYRSTQRALLEMTEKAAEVDQLKGATLDQISQMVEKINREFKTKQTQLQPLMQELKNVRQEYMDLESEYSEKKSTYDKVAVGLEMEKTGLEKECDAFQEECLREESRFHYLNSLVSVARIRLERAEQEKKWQSGDGRMMRDFGSFKELYAHKLTQQEQLTKQLRKRQKELKENAEAMTNQKTNFLNLQALLDAKMKCMQGGSPGSAGPGGRRDGAGAETMAFAETMSFGSANVMSMDSRSGSGGYY